MPLTFFLNLSLPIWLFMKTVYVHVQLCLILWDPLDCNPPGLLVHGISQVRILEWDLSDPGIEPVSLASPASAGGFFITEPPGKPSVKAMVNSLQLDSPHLGPSACHNLAAVLQSQWEDSLEAVAISQSLVSPHGLCSPLSCFLITPNLYVLAWPKSSFRFFQKFNELFVQINTSLLSPTP